MVCSAVESAHGVVLPPAAARESRCHSDHAVTLLHGRTLALRADGLAGVAQTVIANIGVSEEMIQRKVSINGV